MAPTTTITLPFNNPLPSAIQPPPRPARTPRPAAGAGADAAAPAAGAEAAAPATAAEPPAATPSQTEPHSLTPLRAHYLKRELVTLQFAAELESLATPHVLSLLGPPFLPSHLFKHGVPLIPESTILASPSSAAHSHSHHQQHITQLQQRHPANTGLPFLKFFFTKFVLSFPFLENVPATFFSHKLQPFVYSFFARNITRTDDRLEETSRQKIAGKLEKHLALIMAAAIRLSDNNGQEQVVRVSPNCDPAPTDDDAFLSTPILPPPQDQGLPNIPAPTINNPQPPSFDLNVVAIRRVRTRSRMRSKLHEEFVIRTRSQATGEIYVSRRYRDVFKLADSLRVEFPDIVIRAPPPKDRSAIHTEDLPSPSMNLSPTLGGPATDHAHPRTKIHFTREHNRLTLRAYLHRLLTKPEIANSEQFRSFLTDEPIELSPEEMRDAENREAIDRAREDEKNRFRLEVEGRVRELDDYLRGFREELVKSDGLSRVFATIREVDNVASLPIEYRKVIEWSRISLASTIYQVFLGSDNSSASFAQLKRMHALIPYWAMRQQSKHFFFTQHDWGLYEEIREFKDDAEKVAAKIADSRLCEKIKTFVEAPREIQEIFESDAKSENIDLIAVILRSPEGPHLDKAAYQRIQRASQAYEKYKNYRDGLDDPALDEGPDNDDAWLFEDLHVYMRLLRRCRDKEQLVELLFEGTTSELLKDIVTIFYAPLMQVYKAANISDSLIDLQKFIDDLIRTVERADEVAVRDAQKIVQTFVDLVARHEGAFYNFVHQVHSKGAGLFDGLMHWIELLVNFVRQGLTNTISLEALLPHPDTPERLALMKEIDETIEYHRRLKIAHHERMMRRLARDGPEERYDREKDSAFVSGMMQNLNLSEGVVKDVEEAANEDLDDSDQEEYDPGRMSACSSASRAPDENPHHATNHHLRRNGSPAHKSHKNKEIEPPHLVIIPTLTPLFTELVKNLLR